MNWLEFWQNLRAPLVEIPLLGESGPWVFLVAVVLLCELISDRFVVPKLILTGHEKAAAILDRDLNGLRSGVIVAGFSGLTTLEKETAILALIAGAVTVALRHWKSIRAYMADQLMGPFVVLLLWMCGGCSPARHPERDACYLAADQAAAQAYLTECWGYPDTRACPHGNAIEERHGDALEACP